MKIEAACFTETSVIIYKATRFHMPKDRNLHVQHRRNLKFNLERDFLGLLVGARVSLYENCDIK
jgi:hypothetical protein